MAYPKQVKIKYDHEGGYFLIVLITTDGQEEVLGTEDDPSDAEFMAERFAYGFGVDYDPESFCGNDCGRKLPPAKETPSEGTFCYSCAGNVSTRLCTNGYPYPINQRFCDCRVCSSEREMAKWEALAWEMDQ